MLERIWPITSRLFRRFGNQSLHAKAEEVAVLDEGRVWNARPLIHLPGELDRIKGDHPQTDPSVNRELIACSHHGQGPTKAYRFRDVVIADACATGSSWVLSLRDERRRSILPRLQEFSEPAALCSTMVSERFFGHWLRDQLPHEILAADLALAPVALPGTKRANEDEYRSLTKLEAFKPGPSLFRDLWIFDDHQITDHRVARIQRLRDLIRGSVAGSGKDIVYVARGQGGVGRTLANEAELAEALQAQGIAVLYPEELPVREIISTLKDAKVVIGPEGSAIAHALCAMPEGSTLIQIQPPFQFNMHYRIYTEALDIAFGVVIGDHVEEGRYAIDIERVMRTIDLI